MMKSLVALTSCPFYNNNSQFCESHSIKIKWIIFRSLLLVNKGLYFHLYFFMDELFVYAALAEWYDFCSIYSQAFQQSLGSPVSIMLLDRDTYQLDVLASHVPTRCVLAQVAVGNDWHPRAPGGHPPGINSLLGVGFIAWCPFLGECWWGPKHFWAIQPYFSWFSILHLDPPKKRPCATLVCFVGAYNKYIKMSHRIRAIRDNTSLNVIKRNRKK